MAGSWQVLTNRYFEREGNKKEDSNLLSGDEDDSKSDNGDNSPDDNNYFGQTGRKAAGSGSNKFLLGSRNYMRRMESKS